jgi:hypothetical protein
LVQVVGGGWVGSLLVRVVGEEGWVGSLMVRAVGGKGWMDVGGRVIAVVTYYLVMLPGNVY